MRSHLLSLSLLFVAAAASAQETNPAEDLYAGGQASEMELRTFGRYVRAGDKIEEKPLHRFMLSLVAALYGISQQHGQVLRVCEYGESIAQDPEERQESRRCRLGALTNLGRFSEAESLAVGDGHWLPNESSSDPLQPIVDLQWIASMGLNQGNMLAAEESYARILKLTSSVRRRLSSPSATPEISAEVSMHVRNVSLSNLSHLEINAHDQLARIAYYRQDFGSYRTLVQRLLQNPELVGNSWGIHAIEHAKLLHDQGDFSEARSLAQRALPLLKADAGFRDQPEPLQNFRTLEAATAVLGDERMQTGHVYSWVRLATAYSLTDRDAEAARLLDSAEALARQYLPEPVHSSSLLAAVEEAQADLAAKRASWTEAATLLRAARARLQSRVATERSIELGRRQLAIDSPLLQIDAKLLFALTLGGTVQAHQGLDIQELADIANDFSASRADLNATLASRAQLADSDEIKRIIQREGHLVDEMVDLRGQLNARIIRNDSSSGGSAANKAVARLAEIYEELGRIKSQLRGFGFSDPETSPDTFRQRLGSHRAYWQWISHPNANITLSWTQAGVIASPLRESFQQIRRRVQELQAGVSLRNVETRRQLKPYPMKRANELYRVLFGDLAPRVASTRQWMLATSPLVDGIPWGALRLHSGTSNQNGQNWLIERAELTVVPSWKTWLSLSERPPAAGRKRLLAIGDPINAAYAVPLGDLKVRGAYVAKALDSTVETSTPDSAFAQELSLVAALFRESERKVLSGKNATKKKLIALPLSDFRILLFSTHGYLGRDLAMSIGPSLELTASSQSPEDRFLATSEIARLKLDADIVLLSACDTSASDGYDSSEGYSGLTSAFLLAGARNVVATLWPVETEATKEIITRTLRYHIRGTEPEIAGALRHATLDILRSDARWMHHPAYWAPFLVVGR